MGASGLGALLVKEGFLTEQDRVTITKTCGQGSWAFAKCILSTGLLDEDELSAFFAERTKYVVAPKNLLDRLDTGIVEQIDRRMVSRLEVLPLEIDHHKITVAVADPLDKSTIKQLEFFTGLEVISVIAPLSQIYEGLSRLNPDFKPRPTALSNFLRNHAGTAWIKQKIVEEGDVDVPQERSSARAGVVEDWNDEQVEDVSLDDEDDDLGSLDGSDNLNDIDAGGLDEGMGNSDFDDIELEDANADLELAGGEGGDDLDAGEPIDDAGLDLDDPFDSFDDAPKSAKATAEPSDDDLDGLETAGGSSEDLWDDEPAAPAAKAAPKPAAKAAPKPADVDFGLDDEPDMNSKPMAKDDDFGAGADDLLAEEPETSPDDVDDLLADEPAVKAKAKAKPADDDFGADDLLADQPTVKAKAKAKPADDLLADEPAVKAKAKAKPADDLMAESDDVDDLLADEPAVKANSDDDFGADVDDLLADEPVAKAKPKAKAKPADDLMAESDDVDDLLADEPAVKANSDDDFGADVDDLLADEPVAKAKPKAKAKPADDLMAESDDVDDLLADEPVAKAKPKTKAKSADDDIGMDVDDLLADAPAEAESDDDFGADDLMADEPAAKAKPKAKTKPADDDFGADDLMAESGDADDLLADEAAMKTKSDDDVDDLLADEPPAKPKPRAEPAKPAPPSTRMNTRPAPEEDEDLTGLEFASDEETSASLRKAVHEDGVLPEFTDPGFEDIKEETRIDLHAAIDEDLQFEEDEPEETQIKLHAAPTTEPAIQAEEDSLDDLAMGFNDEEAIDEPEVAAPRAAAPSFSEPGIDDLGAAELDDIPIDEPTPPARAAGATAASADNGSVASLTATAKANEALLRMSLCFDRNSALEIAREYLPQISATGCLVQLGKTTESLANWRSGAQAAATKGKPSPVLQRMAKEAKFGQWSQIAVGAKDEIFGSVKSVSVYKIQKADGSSLLLAGDYPLEDETLREALTSFAEQLGAK